MRARFVEEDLAALATRQHGVVARRQLLALGLGAAAIGRRVGAGRLHRVHTGVYPVGHPVLGVYGRWMAAVLACGPEAALGYASAAAFWDLRRGVPTMIDVVVATAGGRTRPGLRVHRHPGMASDEVRIERAIRVTTPARTILDYAAVATDRELEYALDQAEIQPLTDYPALDALARAHPRHRGSVRLRRILADYEAGADNTRSDLEQAFLALCARHGLPPPLVNEPTAGITVDFVFKGERVAVETDSWRWHRGRAAFERDRQRDALLAAAGYTTLRFTDRQIERAETSVVRALTAALTQRAA
jgi:predicted transcriptional regulator of viral defense system